MSKYYIIKNYLTMSLCDSNQCVPNISADSLNTRLIPTFLNGMTKLQQTAYINASTSAANLFRNQVIDFITKLTIAKKQQVKKRFVCPLKVVWSVTNSPLQINHESLVNYYDFMINSKTDFAFIASTVLATMRAKKTCNINKQNGLANCSGIIC
jgi:hypothetical protein